MIQGINTVGDASLTASSGLTNRGRIILETVGSSRFVSLTVSGGSLVNVETGDIEVRAGGGRTITAQLVNRGVIELGTATTLNGSAKDHVNSGTINISGGNLTLNQSSFSPTFTNTGPINISAGRTFTVNNGTFTTSAPGIVTGDGAFVLNDLTLNFNGGAITDSPLLTSSRLNIGNGVMTGGAVFTMRGGGNNLSGTIRGNQELVIQGSGIGDASVTASSGLTNRGRIILETVGSSRFVTLTVNGGSLVNVETGDIEVRAGGGRTITAQLVNRGVIELGTATTLNGSSKDHVNSGTINITGGNLTLNQSSTSPSFTNTGPINISAGRTFTVNNGVFTTSTPGIVTGDGAFVLNDLTLNFNGGAITDSPLLTSSRLNIGNGVMTGGAVFTMMGGGNNLSGAIRGNQELVIQGSNIGDASVTASSGLTNRGRIILETVGSSRFVTLTVNGGSLVNVETGDIEVRAGGGRTITAQLVNRGVIELGTATTLNGSSKDHVNSGTININGGNLTLNQSGTTPSFTNTGPITVSAGRTFTVNNGVFTTSAPGIVTGDGAFVLNDLTLNFNGGAITQAPLLTSSRLNIGNGVMTGGAVFTMMGGGNNLSGTIRGNQELVIQGSGIGDASVTASSGLTNRGRIILETVGSSRFVTLTVNGGSLVNVETGDIEVRAGSGGGRTITAQLTNHGTFNVGTNTTVGRSGADHINDGAMSINNAAVTFTGNTLTNTPGGTIKGVGTLNVSSVPFTNDGRMAPGLSPGILNLTGNYTQGLGGALDIEIGGLVPGAGFDQLKVTGNADLDGTLKVSLVPGFIPVSGDAFRVLTFGSGVGQFAAFNDADPADGVSFEAIFDASGLTLRASVVDVPVVVPGDVNGDGRVDSSDLRIVVKKFNTGDAEGDVNRDGKVDILDLVAVAAELDSAQ